jgi:hypothetical protein
MRIITATFSRSEILQQPHIAARINPVDRQILSVPRRYPPRRLNPPQLDIELRYRTSFWDALILQAAESSGATILYTEDLATGQRYRAVQVVNPLIQPIGTQ